MNINPTTPYNQNFQARIKMNKPNLTKILTPVSLGTTALTSLALQTDFDLACANATIATSNDAQEPSYQGITLPFLNAASDYANIENPNFAESTTATVGASATPVLSMQLGSSAGSNLLDKVTGKVFSETLDNISFKLGKEKRQELALSNAATVGLASSMAVGNGLDQEGLVTLGTIASTTGVYNTAQIVDAYDKTSKYNKKFPS